jgi:hypothetical protein
MLMDNGMQITLWVSRTGGPHIEEIFGIAEVEHINWAEVQYNII